ncbi:MAG: OmpH family outer membrane protein [Bacteroidales bacterium]|nr:OmpH family outer membrane protein [Bacteroidales bacterium]
MKNFILLFASLLLMMSCTQNKLAYIDVGLIMKEYEGMKAFEQQMEDETVQLRKEIESLIEPYQLKVEAYYKNVGQMSEARRSATELALQEEQAAINKQQDDFMQQLEVKRLEGLEAINDEISVFVKDYAKSRGLQIVLGTIGTGTVIYGEDKLNISQDVLSELNRLYGGE